MSSRTGSSLYQQNCSGLLGRTSLRPDDPAAPRQVLAPHCSGLLGRTSLRPTSSSGPFGQLAPPLFRPSRPDFIETYTAHLLCPNEGHCSGLLGRTSLRQSGESVDAVDHATLFRPSRPDFIETWAALGSRAGTATNCSGLLGRTSLRQQPEHLNLGISEIVPAF